MASPLHELLTTATTEMSVLGCLLPMTLPPTSAADVDVDTAVEEETALPFTAEELTDMDLKKRQIRETWKL